METKILLLTHGGWGTKLVDSLKMILGEINCCHEIPLLPEYTLSDYLALVNEYVQTISKDSIIITDMFGGTPSNVAAKIGNDTGIKVICGLNAPMLLEVCSQLQFQNCINFDLVLEAGKSACKDVLFEIKEKMKN